MVVDLRWSDATAIFGVRRVFTPAQQKVAWPDSMGPEQLAALQRPWDRGDTKERDRCWSLRKMLDAACDAGQLECVALAVEPPTSPAGADVFRPIPLVDGWGIDPSQEWTERSFLGGTLRTPRRAPKPPQHSPSEKTARLEYRIDAHAFATWLYTQKQEPSAHIAVWFEVRGVAWPPVLAVAPDDATPVSPFPLVDFDALAAYRKAQKAANVAAGKSHKTIPWTDGNQLEVLRTEYERLGQTPSAYTSIANVLGTTRQAVESALKSERKRKTASPLPSVAAKRIA